MYENIKREIIETALKLKEYRLISLSGGNVSVRTECGHVLITPSGMSYEGMVEDDIIVLDIEGNIIEGKRRPSVDTEPIIYIYKNMEKVNAVIHTHQVYATAVGLISNELPAGVTTLPNATLGPVNVAPYSSAASLEMGVLTVKHIGDKRAIILKNHGVITVGENLKQALYAAVYMEDAAKTYLLAKMAGNPIILNQQQIDEAVAVFENYGQK